MRRLWLHWSLGSGLERGKENKEEEKGDESTELRDDT